VNPVPKPEKQPKKTRTSLKNKYDPIPRKIKAEIYDRDKGICQGCGVIGVHLHHIIFRSQGGKHTVDNLVTLCNDCHTRAHNCREERFHWEVWRDEKYFKD
jgi:5-methylcytosine-specific restriction endonuclease McrA